MVVERAPALGVLRLGERTLSARQQFAFADLPKLDYQPAVGSDGRKDSFALALTGAKSATATVAVAPALDACDREAASPLDLQGVGAGKLAQRDRRRPRHRRLPESRRRLSRRGALRLSARPRACWRSGKTAEAKTLDRAGGRRQAHPRDLGTRQPRSLRRARRRRPRQANGYYKQCADAGDAYCALAYGRNLYYGRGVAQDRKAGLQLMLRAAGLGHTYAMNELGYIFLYGKGQPVDAERGIRFYEAGAERDDIYSLNNLGLVYLRGTGRPADPAKALNFFTRAAAGGHPKAPTNLGRWRATASAAPKDIAAARRWFEVAAERGDYWGALYRAQMERDTAVLARYLALAVSFNREDDNYDPDKAGGTGAAKDPGRRSEARPRSVGTAGRGGRRSADAVDRNAGARSGAAAIRGSICSDGRP